MLYMLYLNKCFIIDDFLVKIVSCCHNYIYKTNKEQFKQQKLYNYIYLGIYF